jgi:hypothetical protein
MQMICVCLQRQEDLVVKIEHWLEGMESKRLGVIWVRRRVCVVGLDLGRWKILESGHMQCVEKELEQTQ